MMKTKQQALFGPHRQRGIATLILSMVILVTITFVVFYTSRSVLMETRVTNNDYRSRMAFEAAEEGIEAAIGAIANGWTLNVTLDVNGNIQTSINDTTNFDVIFDANDDGALTGNADGADLANGARVDVVLNGAITNDLLRYNVTSTGKSDDRTATRVIRQVFVMVPPIPNMPDAPLLSRTAIAIGGSANVSNPEGHSTIWAGTNVDIGTNATTSTSIANPTDQNYPNCLGGSVRCGVTPSSSNEVQGLDIIGNDTNLQNLSDVEFFHNFLGDSPDNFRRTRTDIITDETNFGSLTGSGSAGKVIWVDTADGTVDLQANGAFGSLTQPALIIINGDLDIQGGPTFNGMVYVTGSIKGSGTPVVNGALVVNGAATTGGTINVVYNSQVLKLLNKASGAPSGSSGSWRDW